jgi:hypothetical protein
MGVLMRGNPARKSAPEFDAAWQMPLSMPRG